MFCMGGPLSRIYASDPRRVPGPYQNRLLATVEHRRVTQSEPKGAGIVDETWAVHEQPSHTMSLNIKYEQGTPTRQKSEGKVYSSVNTSFYRIYRWDLLADVAKSGPAGVDRMTSYSFDAAIPEYTSGTARGDFRVELSPGQSSALASIRTRLAH
jgi:hypothetical protein